MSRKIYIIGVGLIGGSFALEIKKIFPDSNIIGIDNSKENLDQAINLGIVDTIGSIDDITNPFMILLAIPVKSIINILPNALDKSTQDTIVIDFGSTKNSICKSVINHKNRSNFVAAHPIAGTEFSGPNAAHYGLFDNKNIIICEHEKSNDNIINNIAFGINEEEIDLERIDICLEMAELKDFVYSLNDGIYTNVGDRGSMISGGQKQRIGLARALYLNPEILILDESTSSLDSIIEKNILKTIYNLKGKKTIIMIAHNQSVLYDCDILYNLEHGDLNQFSI